MPEGDAVYRTATRLRQALDGRVLTRSDFRVPRHATADLTGRVVLTTVSRGKHLLTRVEGGLTVHTHLRMDGSWRVTAARDASGRPAAPRDPRHAPAASDDATRGPTTPDDTTGRYAIPDDTTGRYAIPEGAWRRSRARGGGSPYRDGGGRSVGPGDVVRLVLANADWEAVGVRLGMVDLLETADEARVVGHLGPDLLGEDWDPAEAVRRLREDPGRTIGDALLDQRNLAGIGTIYRAETLFLRGIWPWRKVGDIEDLEGVVTLAHRLLDANKTWAGTVTTGDRRPAAQTWVYGRAGRPCRRCGTRISRGEMGARSQERLVLWCAGCQPP
ncbi:DNA-formamidopyrimidine glycosylase family protein [Nonomuraea lactucae]|uniref:DNA-formamidopyrimidine glycosylase family protein n=1 Tax=Nonomuraea lactucae TaxID=2249762 RepID=UPI001F05590E|nr:DNA-formamidopyrimidine glycosylase family protein [Nonomuraea lactucae]